MICIDMINHVDNSNIKPTSSYESIHLTVRLTQLTKLSDLRYNLLMIGFYTTLNWCGQSLAINSLKHLIDQSEQKILQIDQSKNASKHF